MDSPPAAATAVLYDGRSAEMLVAYVDAATGGLCTLEFHETKADLGEVELFRTYAWERGSTPGAMVLMPESGHRLLQLDEYWLMWRSGILLYGQSVHHPGALAAGVDANERLVDRPIVTASQELHAYAWRGRKLFRHRYLPRQEGQPLVSIDLIWEAEEAPLRSVCVPVPGGDKGAAMVGFIAESGEALSATMLHVRGTNAVPLEGKTEGKYRLMGRHRLALHAGVKLRPALAVMGVGRDDEAYTLLEAQFDFGKGECVWKRTKIEFLAPGCLQSAAIFHYKSQNAPDPFILAVDANGHLIWLRKRIVQVLRENVGPDYGYPVLTTMNNRYEAVGAGADIRLMKF
jgi:hypothetical protein